jgi:sporulation integral membrane protein YtvI
MHFSGERLLKILFALALLIILYKIRGVFTPFLLAAIIAYLINPVVRYLEERAVPRVPAILIVYLAILVATTLIVLFIIPIASEEIEHFAKVFPQEVERIRSTRYLAYRGYKRDGIPETLKTVADETIRDIEDGLLKFLRGVVESIIGLFSHIVSFILAPVLAFYMTRDLEKIKEELLSWLPWSKQGLAMEILTDVDRVIGGYIRGQVMVSLIIALLSSIGLYILGLDFSVILGLVAGVTNIIPYFGPVIGAIPSTCIALIESPKLAIRVALLFALVQQIDNSVVSPKIIGDSVGLHPLVVIFSLLVGGQLFGFAGMLLAVPAAATIKVVMSHFRPILS